MLCLPGEEGGRRRGSCAPGVVFTTNEKIAAEENQRGGGGGRRERRPDGGVVGEVAAPQRAPQVPRGVAAAAAAAAVVVAVEVARRPGAVRPLTRARPLRPDLRDLLALPPAGRPTETAPPLSPPPCQRKGGSSTPSVRGLHCRPPQHPPHGRSPRLRRRTLRMLGEQISRPAYEPKQNEQTRLVGGRRRQIWRRWRLPRRRFATRCMALALARVVWSVPPASPPRKCAHWRGSSRTEKSTRRKLRGSFTDPVPSHCRPWSAQRVLLTEGGGGNIATASVFSPGYGFPLFPQLFGMEVCMISLIFREQPPPPLLL